MAKPKTTPVHPQTVLVGQTIRSKESKSDEVVRKVWVHYELSNGMTERYDDTETVALVDVPPVEFPPELVP